MLLKGKIFGVAIFGAGRIGRVHAGNIAAHPNSRIAMIVDPNGASAMNLATSYNAEVGTQDEVLANPDVDAIVICSATETHADLVEAGIMAGKAVFCEKPIDLSMERVNTTLEKIKDRPEPLFLAFNRRFDPGVADLKQRLEAGVIGDLELVTIASKDPGALPIEYLKVSGGMFRDMTIHDFDMARYILGEEPIRVSATASVLTDPNIKALGDIDTACVTMQTATGKIAVITNSRRASFGYDQRIEAHGSLGTLRTENVPRTMLVQEREDGVLREKPLYFFLERYAASYAAEWDEFIKVLHENKEPSPSGEDGRRALMLAEAAYKSLETEQTIKLSH